MGQAALDLPNSVDQTPAPLSGADDLLSQMAGQEIDRLLAEADESRAEPAAVAAEPGNDASPLPEMSEDELEKLVAPARIDAQLPPAASAPAVTVPPTAAPADPAAASADPYAAELEAVFKQMESGVAPMLSPDASSIPPAEFATTHAEFEALTQPDHASPAGRDELLDSGERDSLLVRVLELLNAPLAFCSDSVRDILGKIAILTLMNAVGVLLYLLLFKK